MNYEIVEKDNLFMSLSKIFLLSGQEKTEVENSLEVLSYFIKDISTKTFIGIEYPYVDKLYRDSYSSYYSMKLKEYKRNCIRLSFFSKKVSYDDFFTPEKIQELEKHFLGFLILRPTPPNIIGRNFFKPNTFFKSSDVYVTTTLICPTINGVKLKIEGFPHCSQDSEMMVCAETTLWTIVEYFSNRYPDYKSILPQEINSILYDQSFERQIPSHGLTAYQMSFVLKNLGLGVRMYSSERYHLDYIHKLIRIYVESGIPVVTFIGNKNVAHVLNIIGRTQYDNHNAFRFPVHKKLSSGSYLYNFYEQHSKYLVVDDNLPPYSCISLSDPAENYKGADEWDNCEIISVIAPLHNEIYMEADRAESVIYSWLFALDEEMPLPSMVVRVFLSSCRSFKNFIARNPDIVSKEVKQKIINIDMPKFVWLAELSDPEMALSEKANGIIIMDATEPGTPNIIGSFINNKFLTLLDGEYKADDLPLLPFKIFNNLQIFKNGTKHNAA